MENTHKSLKKGYLFKLSFCAVMIALGTVLSLLKVFQAPYGGSVTIASMLPVMLVSYFCGLGWGVGSSAIYALIQLFLDLGSISGWGLSASSFIGCIMFDYILAFTALGFAGMFRKKGASTKSHLIRFGLGMLVVVAIRFLMHFISGTIIFNEWAVFQPAWLYSICYNGGFLLPDLIICVIIGFAVFTPIRKLFENYAK